ncbi:MAG: aldehyde dehydrogenase family protein [Sandaracinaceae bacterium]
MKTYPMSIGGEPVTAAPTLDVVDPATAEPFARVGDAPRELLERAVTAAREAFGPWSALSQEARGDALRSTAGLLEEHKDELAELIMREVGKPLGKGHGELASSLKWMAADAALELPTEVLRDSDRWRVELRRHPLGVVGAITAWNYPILLAFFKIGPALITGNTVVLKPSPYTPVSTLRACELAQEVLPPGVLNCVSGGDELGRWMTEHPAIRKITFTGSVATGKKIMASAATHLKRLTLELGGNDAGIVLDDVDLDAIKADLFWAGFANCGQVCAALKRLYVPASRHDEVIDALVEVGRTVKVGPGTDETSQVGPVQNAMQLDVVRAAVDDAVAKGARIAFRGQAPAGPGYFHPITILADVPDDAVIVQREAFGPVLPVLRYHDLDDAIARANDTDYGLGGSIWSSDLERANGLVGRLDAGNVWVNDHPTMGPDVPWGGIKQSGLGKEGSRYGHEEFTDARAVWLRKR